MGVAPGLTAIAMAATIATRWFTAQRGLVLGILLAHRHGTKLQTHPI